MVTEADLERELAMLRATAAGDCCGVFGPRSMVWRIDREAAVFLAAGRALLLQLAHPWVAAAIAQHSQTLRNPIGRFQRTFGVVFKLVFGTTDEAAAAARRLYHRHAAITGIFGESVGRFPIGTAYRANDVAALRWVFATLVDSAVVAFELVNPSLLAEDRERYYTQSRLFAGFFGIPQSALPQSWPEFADYVDRMIASEAITVSLAARAIAAELLAGAGSRLRPPFWYRALTARLLPERLRDDFEMPFGPAEQRAAARALAVIRVLYPRAPAWLRYVAPYREACVRLAGQRSGPLIRLMNRFWIGRASISD
ncbi:MAG: DUF2236 domain-containing protein [Alphaproteobacteria bacterium]|nr:DUF2236 domain-containing protein [Alphaproteobacteria bacterium]